jgi:hypothetical protein
MKEEVFKYLNRLESRDFSGSTLGTEKTPLVIEGEYNRIDLSKARGYVKIVSDFTNLVDASHAEGLRLILEGKFNIVDASYGKISLNREKAEINILDASGSEEVKLEEIDISE